MVDVCVLTAQRPRNWLASSGGAAVVVVVVVVDLDVDVVARPVASAPAGRGEGDKEKGEEEEGGVSCMHDAINRMVDCKTTTLQRDTLLPFIRAVKLGE